MWSKGKLGERKGEELVGWVGRDPVFLLLPSTLSPFFFFFPMSRNPMEEAFRRLDRPPQPLLSSSASRGEEGELVNRPPSSVVAAPFPTVTEVPGDGDEDLLLVSVDCVPVADEERARLQTEFENQRLAVERMIESGCSRSMVQRMPVKARGGTRSKSHVAAATHPMQLRLRATADALALEAQKIRVDLQSDEDKKNLEQMRSYALRDQRMLTDEKLLLERQGSWDKTFLWKFHFQTLRQAVKEEKWEISKFKTKEELVQRLLIEVQKSSIVSEVKALEAIEDIHVGSFQTNAAPLDSDTELRKVPLMGLSSNADEKGELIERGWSVDSLGQVSQMTLGNYATRTEMITNHRLGALPTKMDLIQYLLSKRDEFVSKLEKLNEAFQDGGPAAEENQQRGNLFLFDIGWRYLERLDRDLLLLLARTFRFFPGGKEEALEDADASMLRRTIYPNILTYQYPEFDPEDTTTWSRRALENVSPEDLPGLYETKMESNIPITSSEEFRDALFRYGRMARNMTLADETVKKATQRASKGPLYDEDEKVFVPEASELQERWESLHDYKDGFVDPQKKQRVSDMLTKLQLAYQVFLYNHLQRQQTFLGAFILEKKVVYEMNMEDRLKKVNAQMQQLQDEENLLSKGKQARLTMESLDLIAKSIQLTYVESTSTEGKPNHRQLVLAVKSLKSQVNHWLAVPSKLIPLDENADETPQYLEKAIWSAKDSCMTSLEEVNGLVVQADDLVSRVEVMTTTDAQAVLDTLRQKTTWMLKSCLVYALRVLVKVQGYIEYDKWKALGTDNPLIVELDKELTHYSEEQLVRVNVATQTMIVLENTVPHILDRSILLVAALLRMPIPLDFMFPDKVDKLAPTTAEFRSLANETWLVPGTGLRDQAQIQAMLEYDLLESGVLDSTNPYVRKTKEFLESQSWQSIRMEHSVTVLRQHRVFLVNFIGAEDGFTYYEGDAVDEAREALEAIHDDEVDILTWVQALSNLYNAILQEGDKTEPVVQKQADVVPITSEDVDSHIGYDEEEEEEESSKSEPLVEPVEPEPLAEPEPLRESEDQDDDDEDEVATTSTTTEDEPEPVPALESEDDIKSTKTEADMPPEPSTETRPLPPREETVEYATLIETETKFMIELVDRVDVLSSKFPPPPEPETKISTIEKGLVGEGLKSLYDISTTAIESLQNMGRLAPGTHMSTSYIVKVNGLVQLYGSAFHSITDIAEAQVLPWVSEASRESWSKTLATTSTDAHDRPSKTVLHLSHQFQILHGALGQLRSNFVYGSTSGAVQSKYEIKLQNLRLQHEQEAAALAETYVHRAKAMETQLTEANTKLASLRERLAQSQSQVESFTHLVSKAQQRLQASLSNAEASIRVLEAQSRQLAARLTGVSSSEGPDIGVTPGPTIVSYLPDITSIPRPIPISDLPDEPAPSISEPEIAAMDTGSVDDHLRRLHERISEEERHMSDLQSHVNRAAEMPLAEEEENPGAGGPSIPINMRSQFVPYTLKEEEDMDFRGYPSNPDLRDGAGGLLIDSERQAVGLPRATADERIDLALEFNLFWKACVDLSHVAPPRPVPVDSILKIQTFTLTQLNRYLLVLSTAHTFLDHVPGSGLASTQADTIRVRVIHKAIDGWAFYVMREVWKRLHVVMSRGDDGLIRLQLNDYETDAMRQRKEINIQLGILSSLDDIEAKILGPTLRLMLFAWPMLHSSQSVTETQALEIMRQTEVFQELNDPNLRNQNMPDLGIRRDRFLDPNVSNADVVYNWFAAHPRSPLFAPPAAVRHIVETQAEDARAAKYGERWVDGRGWGNTFLASDPVIPTSLWEQKEREEKLSMFADSPQTQSRARPNTATPGVLGGPVDVSRARPNVSESGVFENTIVSPMPFGVPGEAVLASIVQPDNALAAEARAERAGERSVTIEEEGPETNASRSMLSGKAKAASTARAAGGCQSCFRRLQEPTTRYANACHTCGRGTYGQDVPQWDTDPRDETEASREALSGKTKLWSTTAKEAGGCATCGRKPAVYLTTRYAGGCHTCGGGVGDEYQTRCDIEKNATPEDEAEEVELSRSTLRGKTKLWSTAAREAGGCATCGQKPAVYLTTRYASGCRACGGGGEYGQDPTLMYIDPAETGVPHDMELLMATSKNAKAAPAKKQVGLSSRHPVGCSPLYPLKVKVPRETAPAPAMQAQQEDEEDDPNALTDED